MNYLAAAILAIFILNTGPLNENTQRVKTSYCDLKGSVYIVDNPQQANFKVYEEDSEAFADMLVYETDNSLYADKPGVWYFVNNIGFADFTVYMVDSKQNADFTIYYTSYESMAGCSNQQ
jgi:hypothetical protein